VGNLLKGQTVGVIGAGRIGSAYARMMVISYSQLSNLVYRPDPPCPPWFSLGWTLMELMHLRLSGNLVPGVSS
jgi:hypothetical protein